jgi:sugar phosphate isomerase/epimerase
VLSHLSLAPDHPVEDRVASAAASGFAGIGLSTKQYRQLEADGFAPAGLHDLLDEHAICLAEVEVVRGWARGGADDTEAVAWRMADAFQCRYLQAIGPYEGTVDDAGRAFAGLCERAGDHGLVVGIEFLPFTNIVTAADALDIVERADRPNGGVCVDIWHHVRGAADLDLIRRLPAERVLAVQMSDGPLRPEDDDYLSDCLDNRLAPGAGAFDAAGFVRVLRGMGVRVPWSVEACHRPAWGEPARERLAELATGMRAVLAAAASPN